MKRRVHVWVSGRVQGVCYRASASDWARTHGLSGWVRNLPDGRVEMVAFGDEPVIAAFLDWCRQGPRFARVEGLDVLDEELIDEFSDFSVR